jgi:ribulose-5-phosphate 4-epimerase/fuculose-1-phosphate aldolase
VKDRFDVPAVVQALSQWKTVIIQTRDPGGNASGPAVIAPGTITPEQGFIHISSVCFACFVKFFSDYLCLLKTDRSDPEMDAVFAQVLPFLTGTKSGDTSSAPFLMPGPFTDEAQVIAAMSQAGKQVVTDRLVDSFFGNISYCLNGILYISQTGAALDELEGCIDPVPLDGSTSAGITASSELSAHLEVIARTGCRAILHGHPRFSVILSMDCDPEQKAACAFNTRCHTHCPVPRHIGDIPIIPGEVGTGPFGLCHTLPEACDTSDTVIVYGHGVFATGGSDFIHAFSRMTEVENFCKHQYFDQIRQLTMRGKGTNET